MYFGSVRFFRHLIVGFVVITMTVTTILSIVFGIQSSKYKKLYDESRATVEDLEISVSKASQDPVSDGEGEVSIPIDDSNNEDLEDTVDLSESELAYQSLYPDMMCDPQDPFTMPEEGTVYLTFDDGPSDVTESVLDTLQKHDVKATFLLLESRYPKTMVMRCWTGLWQMAMNWRFMGIPMNTIRSMNQWNLFSMIFMKFIA